MIKKLLKFLVPYIPLLSVALLLTVAQITATLFAPVVIGRAIDYMIGTNAVNFEYIFKQIIILFFLIIIAVLCQWLASLCTNKVTHNTVRDIRDGAFKKLNLVPLSYIDSTPYGDLISRVVVDTEQIADGLILGFTHLFAGIVTIIGTIIFMLTINLSVTLVVVIITPISIVVAFVLAKTVFSAFKMQSEKRGEMSGLVEEMLSGQKAVKAFRYESRAEQRFDGINAQLKTCGIKAMFVSALTNPCTRFVNSIVYIAVCVFGAFIVVQNPAALSVGMLTCFLAYANQYSKPFNEITGVVTELQSATAAARRLFNLLDEKEEISDIGLPALETCDGCVEIKNVNFSYNPQRPLIENFNLSVLSGQRIAIVGPTGCGKTTLINLLMRFYDTDSGEITVSNQPIKSITRKSLRSCYGMVLQDTWLFSGTIKENIAYGKEDASDDEIIEAAKSAHIHSFIKRLPNGYNTYISDGEDISVGQRQLLCIARIMLTKPPMLILDEATSSIDTRTELKIQSAFQKMMQGRTSFIIAHRLSTIKDADIILVMNDGNVIEKGTHAQLLECQGFYSKLYNSQFEN